MTTLSQLTLTQTSEVLSYDANTSEEMQGNKKNNIDCVWTHGEYFAANGNNSKKKNINKSTFTKILNNFLDKTKKKNAYWAKFRQIINGMGFKLASEAMCEKAGIKSNDGLLYEDAYNSRQSFKDKKTQALFERAKQETDKQMGYSV